MSSKESKFVVGFEVVATLAILGFTVWLLIDSNNFLNKSENYYPPENCNLPAGTYAVQTGVTVRDILKTCSGFEGAPVTGDCSFDVSNLKEAVEKCNQHTDVCERFIFDEDLKTINFVSLQDPLDSTDNDSISLYTKQNGVTYANRQNLGIYS